EQEIGDELARAMVGDLAAAFGRHDGNGPGVVDEGVLARDALREHRRVLEQPDLVARRSVAATGEFAHRLERRQVRREADPADQDRTRRRIHGQTGRVTGSWPDHGMIWY